MDLRALVVCPDQDSANLLMLILSELGLAAEHTPSITRGLELLDSQLFDAIVLDYRADSSSEEFLSRLRQSSKNRATMLVAYSGWARILFCIAPSLRSVRASVCARRVA